MELPLECQDVADKNIYLSHENTSDTIFHCYICGKCFDLNHLLKIHLAEHHKRQENYKTNKCKFCEQKFMSKFGLKKHIKKHRNSKCKCRFCSVIIDRSKYIKHKKRHKRRDQNKLDTIPNIKWNKNQKQFIHTTVRDNFEQQTDIQQLSELKQQSVVSTDSQSSIANNCHTLNIKQEKNLCTNDRERNSSDQVDSVNNNESTLANKPRDLITAQKPINIANNNSASIVRETPYFCIRKLPNIKNGFCNDHYNQTSQNNVIFICRICKNSPSTDIHSFALHMSDHSECNMHECIVCDETFNSVVIWAHHIIYHQEQIDLNVSNIEEHTTIHTLNMYKCDDCGQLFNTNLSHSNHIWENHSDNISTSNKNEHAENY